MKELVLLGVILVFVGVIAILIGTILGISAENIKTESMGIIMIGPLPIMFGSKRLLLPLAITAIILMACFYLFFWKH